MRKIWHKLALLLWLLPTVASAEVVIDITGGIESALPIAIVPFGGERPGMESISAIVSGDLEGSGRFAPLAEQDLIARPHSKAEINFQDWKLLRSEGLLVGQMSQLPSGDYEVQFQLFDVYNGAQLVGRRYQVPARGLRRLAHQISDEVYKALTGEAGVFSTRLVYVAVTGSSIDKEYALKVADADGQNPRTVARSKQPILSPSWSPDGSHLAYVSFENRNPTVFVQHLQSGKRQSVAAYKGTNTAPSWSPDGTQLALSLSKAGNPEIYVMSVATGKLSRVTHNPRAIDTEPEWIPNGRELLFTSDRGGKPQIYRVSVDGGRAERVTFKGDSNSSADVSPDGNYVVMVQGNGSQDSVALQDLETGEVRRLTNTTRDESPSFAPNGKVILYATEERGRQIMAKVTLDGVIHRRVSSNDRARDPAWSPLRK